MQLLPMDKLGAHQKADNKIYFGLYLPWISSIHGHQLNVKIIHEKDQFIQDIKPSSFPLNHSLDPVYGDYWSTTVTIDPVDKQQAHSAWGSNGRYIYRFSLFDPHTQKQIDWIIDPFAREFGVGKLSAITLGYQSYQWSDHENQWKTPQVNDLIIYEMMIHEFGNNIDGAIARLDYLQDLGINCIEIMPVSNVSQAVDWGFLPIGHFGVDERFGNRKQMQYFIDEAHKRGIAVMLDVVYGHTSEQFPYKYLYDQLNYHENPFMGSFAKDYFGSSTDFNRAFTQDYFYTVNEHWLSCYHIDGFRYDCVPNYWDGPLGQGYSKMTYETYQLVKSRLHQNDHWMRFQNNNEITLIQCAEQLEGPIEIVEKTYSNCTWQNETLGAAQKLTSGQSDAVTEFGKRLGLIGYPTEVDNNGDKLSKTALQYIENHDHSRFICNFGTIKKDNDLLQDGDRSKWYKIQPYLIGLFTAQGIPLLWQGQEFGENYFVPWSGWGRVMLYRPVRWDYFYDQTGQAVVKLFRKLSALRKNNSQYRYGKHYFHNHYDHYQSKKILLFDRSDNQKYSLVALNFSDHNQWVPFTFPRSGNYIDELHGHENDTLNIKDVHAGEEQWLEIPSNYGRVWTVTK